MIVRSAEHELWLITQPDHAALAASIVSAWQSDGFPASPVRADILQAVCEHDGGWIDVDREPMVDQSTGRILDFVAAPTRIRQRIWPAAVDRLEDTPYAAALVAEHAITVFERYRSDMEWLAFFATMERKRDEALGRMTPAVGRAQLLRDYFLVNIGDVASLTFCHGWTEPQRCGDYTLTLDGTRLVVSPDPFGGLEVPLRVTARRLPHRPARSQDDARDLFERAPQLELTGHAVGARTP